MTQTEQTTAERVQEAVNPWEPISFGAEKIGSEIDRINADLRDLRLAYDEQSALLATARAQIAALTPKAEAWDAREEANAANANRMSLIMDADAYADAKVVWVAAEERANSAAARAREVSK